MTRRAALGVVARNWGRLAVVSLGWVAGGIVVVALWFFLRPEIDAFLASRPSWGDLIWWGVLLFVIRYAVWPTLPRWRRQAAQAARRKGQRARALNAVWTVLRLARPTEQSHVPPPRRV
jgi:hypothetical protein